MSKGKTVITIGAGGAKDIGMPLGDELYKKICQLDINLIAAILYHSLKERAEIFLVKHPEAAKEGLAGYSVDGFIKCYLSFLIGQYQLTYLEEKRIGINDQDAFNANHKEIMSLAPNDVFFRDNFLHVAEKFQLVKEFLEQDMVGTEPDVKIALSKCPEYEPFICAAKIAKENCRSSVDTLLSHISKDKIILPAFAEKDKVITYIKKLVAFSILCLEDNRKLSSVDNWYHILSEAIVNRDNLDDISIICFNYDRTLDEFFNKHLPPQYREKIKEKIIYPYGSLSEAQDVDENCKFGWLNDALKNALGLEGNDGRIRFDYNSLDLFYNFIADASGSKLCLANFAECIRTIGEPNQYTTQRFGIAERGIKNSHRLYFIGFGFIKENCENLNLSSILSNKERIIFYTNYNGSEERIERYFRMPHGISDRDEEKCRIQSYKRIKDALRNTFDPI